MSASAELRLERLALHSTGTTRRLALAVLATKDREAIEALDAFVAADTDD